MFSWYCLTHRLPSTRSTKVSLHTRLGLRISALAWNESYLDNRLKSTVIRDVNSSLANSLYGVPQGSVLGPLLFSLYVASIEDVIITRGLQSVIFAKDAQMYLVMRRSEQSSCLSKLELCAQDVLSWMTENKLMWLRNSSKREIVHFSSRYLSRQPIATVNIAGSVIKTSVSALDPKVTLTITWQRPLMW